MATKPNRTAQHTTHQHYSQSQARDWRIRTCGEGGHLGVRLLLLVGSGLQQNKLASAKPQHNIATTYHENERSRGDGSENCQQTEAADDLTSNNTTYHIERCTKAQDTHASTTHNNDTRHLEARAVGDR